MSKKTRPTFSPEFRLESAQLVVDQNYSVREAASAIGVGHSTMDKWVRQVRSERSGVTPKQSAMTPDQRRIKELEKKLRRDQEHSTILKKATASLDAGLAEQLKVVRALRESYSLTVLCQAFDFHRSTFKCRQAAARRIDVNRLRVDAMVRHVHRLSNGSAGARSIHRWSVIAPLRSTGIEPAVR